MTQYAKLIDGNLYFPPKNKDGICNYDLDVDALLGDGYKEYIEAEKLDGYIYDISYVENSIVIMEVAEVIKTPEDIRREQFLRDFFPTSLGYVSRKVHMKDGSTKDFLSDILPILEVNAPIITYNQDGTQNVGVPVTEQFIGECKQQVLVDFYGAVQNEEPTEPPVEEPEEEQVEPEENSEEENA